MAPSNAVNSSVILRTLCATKASVHPPERLEHRIAAHPRAQPRVLLCPPQVPLVAGVCALVLLPAAYVFPYPSPPLIGGDHVPALVPALVAPPSPVPQI